MIGKMILLILLIAFMLGIGIYTQKEHAEEVTAFCDKTFGEDNYVWMEGNNFTKCGLAQCWTCVPKSIEDKNE